MPRKGTKLSILFATLVLFTSGCATTHEANSDSPTDTSDSSHQNTVDESASNNDSTDGEPAEKDPAIGVPVTDRNVEFTVHSISCSEEPMSDDKYSPLKPKGQFCKVNVSATALKDIGMYLGQVTVTTKASEKEITESIGAMMYEGTLKADYIDNGETLSGDVVFDIPLDDEISTVIVKSNPLSDGVIISAEQ